MKAASLNELKQELLSESPARLTELCIRLARFKKENKELLTYLLFESHDLDSYVRNVKNEMDAHFETINRSNVYFVKKTLRKILRITNKFIRYSGSARVEVELLIYFCQSIMTFDKAITTNKIISNIYQNQLKKIHKALSLLHEDLQYDYFKEVKNL